MDPGRDDIKRQIQGIRNAVETLRQGVIGNAQPSLDVGIARHVCVSVGEDGPKWQGEFFISTRVLLPR